MNKSRYVLPVLLAAAIGAQVPSAHAAAVVTHWGAPGYSVTTVHAAGPYWGIHPAPCCYAGAAVAGVAAVATIAAVTAVPPPPVVYAAPVVTVYSTAPVVYAPAPYYYVP